MLALDRAAKAVTVGWFTVPHPGGAAGDTGCGPVCYADRIGNEDVGSTPCLRCRRQEENRL